MLVFGSLVAEDPGIFCVHAGLEVERATALMEWGVLPWRSDRMNTYLYLSRFSGVYSNFLGSGRKPAWIPVDPDLELGQCDSIL